LCGSLRHLGEHGRHPGTDASILGFVDELGRLCQGRRTLFIAGADLAHVGPRFGDENPLDAEDRKALERRDQATLEHAARGDAQGWFDEIAREKDCRRICGLSPIYALLATSKPGPGALATYGQCPADEDGGSLVSIASILYGSAPT
jgi:AmmeMemoRadiSam system protein B